MNEQEVKEYIGTTHYNTFIRFMKNRPHFDKSETEFLDEDVEHFKGRLEVMLENPGEYTNDWLTR